MKKLFLACLFLTSFLSCKKENTLTTATILGYDRRLCPSPCCGGFFVNLSTKSIWSEETYLSDTDLSVYGITEKSAFPISVAIEYKIDSLVSCSKHISITKLTKTN